LLLKLSLRQLDRSEPLISKVGDKILIVVVRLEPMEGEQVRPGSRRSGGPSMDSLKEVIIDHMKLGADVLGPEVTY
jgi:hypothetical protein